MRDHLGEQIIEGRRIEAAKAAWRDERFPLVPGDELERSPLP